MATTQPVTRDHVSFGARDIAYVAVFAGVTAALGLVPGIMTPLSPVPITAQTLGVMLAGALLGGRRAFASQTLLLVLVAIGLPLLAGGRGGLHVFTGPSWGFLIGWPIVAALIGYVTYRFGAPYPVWKGVLVNVVFGMVVLYCIGIPGMMSVTHMGLGQAIAANLPYLPGDLVKAVLAALIAKGVHSAYPALLPRRVEAAQSQTAPAAV